MLDGILLFVDLLLCSRVVVTYPRGAPEAEPRLTTAPQSTTRTGQGRRGRHGQPSFFVGSTLGWRQATGRLEPAAGRELTLFPPHSCVGVIRQLTRVHAVRWVVTWDALAGTAVRAVSSAAAVASPPGPREEPR